ncbi:hypothetical protein WJX73_003431 [Symbiochloris irregularis]|uniref:Vesicle transport protein GOT1B n=1 Tax=Symbiochloris irregularis TaxID=706552 RepID=A0AAW1Q286_9CHLO
MDDRKKIGIGLTGFGFLFTFLGVLFFFDRGLLAMGNLLFLCGVAMTIGPSATVRFFMRRKNHKGSGFYLAGFAIVLWGWPIPGMALEGYGFWVLFSGFFPTVLGFLRRLPILGNVLDFPGLKWVINKIAPAQSAGLPL